MRLIDELAANRLYYHRPLPTLPDILLIDIPSRFSGEGLALGRYYPVILETLAELTEFERFLVAERDQLVVPALLDRRPSALRADHIIFARYEPVAPHWPWLLLSCWPQSSTDLVRSPDDAFARGAYTIDAYCDVGRLEAAELTLIATLGQTEVRRIHTSHTFLGRA